MFEAKLRLEKATNDFPQSMNPSRRYSALCHHCTPSCDPAPAEKAYAGKRPGTQPVVARTFSTQPPLIPHAVDNFDEVTLTENQCMDCHGPANYVKKTSPKLGDSHFLAGGKTFDASRHVCTSCHVPQVDAPALVENRFIGNIK